MAKLFICGDIANVSSDQQFISEELQKIIQTADYAICNFEGPIRFNENQKGVVQHPTTLASLKEAGFNMLLLANNHITDSGEEGLEHTINCIGQASFDYLGAGFSYEEVYQPIIKEFEGIRFGFINVGAAQKGHFSYKNQKYGYACSDSLQTAKMIIETRAKVDHLLLFSHTGLEDYNIPIVETRNLYKEYCDLGVDCVIGSHPHVAQGFEKYGNSLIFYSLGNFFFPCQKNKLLENNSFSVLLSFSKNSFEDPEIVYHCSDDTMVHSVQESDSPTNTNNLSLKLSEPEYSLLINDVYQKGFEKYRNAFSNVFNDTGITFQDSLYKIIKKTGSFIFNKKAHKQRQKTLLLDSFWRISQSEIPKQVINHSLTSLLNKNSPSNII